MILYLLPTHTHTHTHTAQTQTKMSTNSNAARGGAAAMILIAACPKERSLRVLDLGTSTTYFTFGDTAPASISSIGGAGGAEGLGSAGDYLVSTQVNEHALVFHRWGKIQPLFKCKTPEQVGPVCASPDGLYVFAGGKSGKVYAWEVATGSLVQTWDAHFKAVTCMTMTSEGSFLLTGSEDTMVRAWSVAEIVAETGAGEEGGGAGVAGGIRPFRSWSEHSLPVTGLWCGQGGPTCRIVSVSLDHTAQIYELAAGEGAGAICAVRAPSGLSCVAMGQGEKRLLLGGSMGEIFVTEMDVVSQARTANRVLVHAVSGGLGEAAAAAGNQQDGGEVSNRLEGHSKAVTALACSWDGKLVISASEDGSLRWWDANSQQCVKKVALDNPGPVAHLLLLPRPTALLEMLPKAVPPAPLQPFKKHRVCAGGIGGVGGGKGVLVNGETVFVPGKKRGRRTEEEQGAMPSASTLFYLDGRQDSVEERKDELAEEEEEEGETMAEEPQEEKTAVLANKKRKKENEQGETKKSSEAAKRKAKANQGPAIPSIPAAKAGSSANKGGRGKGKKK